MLHPLLPVFICVADCGSFHKAAERLYLSPPAVMKQINTLERQLELTLFDRSSRGIRLTAAGQVIYRHARVLTDYCSQAMEEARRQAGAAEKVFCIGTSLLNPCKPFMDLWQRVGREFPGYRLHIVPFEDDHRGILAEIEALGEKYDFLVAACDSALWLSRCHFQRLGSYPICCAVNRDHRLAGREELTVEDLAGETVLLGRAGDAAAVDAARRELEERGDVQLEDLPQFYDMEVFNRCAWAQGVLLTLSCWKDVHPGLVTLPVRWEHAVPYGLLYPREAGADVRKFLSLLQPGG